MTSWRVVALAAVLSATVGARAAGAQTVFVRSAPAGETVEAILNGTTTGTATVDASGDAKIPLDLAKIGKTEIDANIFVDVCDKRHRVVVVERGQIAPAQEGCERRDVPGIFWVRGINTIVVNLATANPTLLLVKGTYTPPAVSASGEPVTSTPGRQAPTGLALFAGGTYTKFRDAAANACGNVSSCTKDDKGIGFTVGGDYWIKKFLAVEAGYLRPTTAKASGSGTGFNFSNSLKSDLVVIAGKVAIPAGPVRIYGTAGMNYHQATSDTTQSQDAITLTMNGVDQTVPAGTQTFQMKTKGWGWLFGGGMEAWIGKNGALFAELNLARIRGDAEGGGEGKIDDRLTTFIVGAKIHAGRQ